MPVELSTIERHTLAIQSITQKSTDPIIETLSKETFWNQLLEQSQQERSVQALHIYWKAIKPLVHLNTKKLLQLLEEHVLPLERSYEYLKDDTQGTLARAQIIEKRVQLTELKSQIFKALILRTKAHQHLNVARQFDDVLAVVIRKLNRTNLIKKLPKLDAISHSLDDDRRLTIFDYLQQAGYNTEDLVKNITAVIPKRSHGLIPSASQSELKIKKLHHFRQALSKQLQPVLPTSAWLEFANEKMEQLFSPLKSKFGFGFIALQKIRYLFYIGLSMLTSYFALQLLSPFILLTFGVQTLGTISNILFYSVGLAPVWLWGWQTGARLLAKVHEFLTYRKTQQILDNLVLLEDFYHFVFEKLESKIIDISHYDIEYLEQRYETLSNALKLAKANLADYSFVEAILCPKSVKQQGQSLLRKLTSAEAKAKSALVKLGAQLAESIKDEIELIDLSLSNEEITPSISKDQIHLLYKFIIKYANSDKEISAKFIQNSNPIDRWAQKFSIESFAIPKDRSTYSLQTPWGAFAKRDDLLNSWQHIILTFELDPVRRNICLELIDVLRGTKEVERDAFYKAIKSLHLGDAEKPFIESLQAYIFATLDSKTAHNAYLLSDAQKASILTWQETYEARIKQANQDLNSLIKNQDMQFFDATLQEWFELLDAEDIYLYSLKAIHLLSQRRNLVRETIESYQGESDVFRFIRFIPKHERATLITHIADKRLGWLLNNNKLTPCDIELFYHPDLITSGFNLRKIVSRSQSGFLPQFKEMSKLHLLNAGDPTPAPQGITGSHKRSRPHVNA